MSHDIDIVQVPRDHADFAEAVCSCGWKSGVQDDVEARNAGFVHRMEHECVDAPATTTRGDGGLTPLDTCDMCGDTALLAPVNGAALCPACVGAVDALSGPRASKWAKAERDQATMTACVCDLHRDPDCRWSGHDSCIPAMQDVALLREMARKLLATPAREMNPREVDRFARGVLDVLTGPIQPDGVHTIPVPRGWSPDQAWEAVKRGDLLTDPDPLWANVLIQNGSFVEVIDA